MSSNRRALLLSVDSNEDCDDDNVVGGDGEVFWFFNFSGTYILIIFLYYTRGHSKSTYALRRWEEIRVKAYVYCFYVILLFKGVKKGVLKPPNLRVRTFWMVPTMNQVYCICCNYYYYFRSIKYKKKTFLHGWIP